VKPRFVKPSDPTIPYRASAVAWPAAVEATLPLAAPAGGAREGATGRAGGNPVWVQAIADPAGYYGGPAEATVRVLDRKASAVNGVVFTLAGRATAGSGTVRIGLDYSGFAQAFGGNYGSRLRLVQLPDCALSASSVTGCGTARPLPSVNDTAGQTVSAEVSLGTTTVVLAATSDAGQEGGPAGSYAATDLKPSGSWSAGGNSGTFSYQYPISVPPTPGGLVPAVSLSYDSGSLDGQTATTWAQSSWVGDGWGTPESFVEQSFVSCADKPEGTASPVSTQDECYAGPILSMSLNGSSSALVWDAGQSVWKSSDESGAVISHITNSGNGTGTYNTDYWQVTERDGTVYLFGRNQLPGWSAGKATTNSVDSQPVYSAHAGDPCYSSSGFTSSVCTMAYRWNLDYVTDVHGNAMSYWYQQNTNLYGRDNGASNASYVRNSYLDHIDYGFTDGNAFGTAPNRVAFTTGSRCLTAPCDPLNSSTSANWPDVPFDLVCASGATCSSWSPTFFSTVRLTGITTQQWSTTSSQYVAVDSYTLTQTLPSTTDHTSPTLWLQSIAHTGSDLTAGGSTAPITLPPISFTPVALANRVDTRNYPPLYRYRIATITTETGSVISPTYSLVSPCSVPVSITPSANTTSCYPVFWTPTGLTEPLLDWFNKYSVTKVTETDPTGGAPARSTSYVYSGGAGWHFDDNEVVQPKYRTYGQFRGFGDVKTLLGDGANDPQTASESVFYRGMSKNNNSTVVNLTDSAGGVHEDLNPLSGRALEETIYLGNGGPVDHSTITSYWVSAPVATRTRVGLPDLTANRVAVAETYSRQALTDGGTTSWRYTETDNSYNAATADALFGTLSHSYTHTVPANAAYDNCTSTTYAPVNPAANLVGLIAEMETDSTACGGFTQGAPASVPAALNTLTAPTSVTRPAQVVSDSRIFYDDPSFATAFPQPAAPTKGGVTMNRSAVDYTGGAFIWQTTKRTAYDSYGRFIDGWDGNGNHMGTAYTMNSVGLTTGVTTTNALGQSTSTTLDPTRGLTMTVTDLNGIVATTQHDALGRLTAVWEYSRPTTANPNEKYTYQISNTGTTAVTSQKLNDSNGYITSTAIYDGMLRVRQTQTATPQSGRMVSDTFYDSRGWVTSTNNGWWDPATLPNTTLVAPARTTIPNQDFYTYDGLGRTVVDTSAKDGLPVSTTTTVHNGDATTVIPPTGGITQTTRTDPLGRTSELDQWTSPPTLHTPSNTFTGAWYLTGGTSTATRYGYDGHGNQNTTTDPAGSTWTSTFNLLGQVTAKTDPDAGTSTMRYDGTGNLTETTDSRGKTVSSQYDPLGRRTGLYNAPTSGQSSTNLLASWVYDNANNVAGVTNPIGRVTTETAYWGGAAYKTQAKAFNAFGESLGETITIPANEGLLAGSYVFTHIYTPTAGLPLKDSYPNAGGLPGETLLYSYTSGLDLLSGYGGLAGYLQTTAYDAWGRITQPTLGANPHTATVTDTYDPHTGRLTDQLVTRSVATPTRVDEQAYAYDLAGNPTRQTSTRNNGAAPTETQCYSYDTVDRLAAAWTATDACAATPTTTSHDNVGDSLGAASAYWTTWTFDSLGQRTSQTAHAFTGGPASDTTTNYSRNGNGTGQPHTLTSTSTTGAASASTSYTYDGAGNMVTRNAIQGNQTLTWNDAGQLASITTPGKGTSTFKYDPEGNLLIQADPGTTTLYLPGEQITLNTTTGTLAGARYYPLPGAGVAIRTGTGTNYRFELTDQHGTPNLYLDNTAQTPTWRQSTPYGEPRGTISTWPDNHGFLNKPENTTTGLTVLGAREYDPTAGHFISLDPLFDKSDPQSWNGYSYADNNPITDTDPNGTDPCGGACNQNDQDYFAWDTGLCHANCNYTESGGGGGNGSKPPGKPGGKKKGFLGSVGSGLVKGWADVNIGATAGIWNTLTSTYDIYSSNITDAWNGDESWGDAAFNLWVYGQNAGAAMVTGPFVGLYQHGKASYDAASKGDWEGAVENGYQAANDLATIVTMAAGATGLVRGAIAAGAEAGAAGAEAGGAADAGTAGRAAARPGGAGEAGSAGDGPSAGRPSNPGPTGDRAFNGRKPGCHSFDPITPVLMADGSTKAIGLIAVGDMVVAKDPDTGQQQNETVTALHINHDNDLTDVLIATRRGEAVIHTTAHHLFWDEARNQWIPAGRLVRDDQLETDAGTPVRVLAARTFAAGREMRDITVDNVHTYYVVADDTAVLVHNCDDDVPDYSKLPDRVDPSEWQAETHEPWRPVDRSEWAHEPRNPPIPKTTWGKFKYVLARAAQIFEEILRTIGKP
jgi:RHS repeat-associated protein